MATLTSVLKCKIQPWYQSVAPPAPYVRGYMFDCKTCGKRRQERLFPLLGEKDGERESWAVERALGTTPLDFTACYECLKKAATRERQAIRLVTPAATTARHRRQAAYHAKIRDARVRQATPSWANRKQMNRLYDRAAAMTKSTGIRHDVDHIIPIIHPLVCGLHVPANLQILTSAENRSKKNIFEPQ